MKTNIKLFAVAVIALVATVYTANAEIKPYKELDSKEVVMNYVGASLLGNANYTKEMFTEDFEYSNTSNKEKFGKKEYVKHLKSLKNLKYNATQSFEIMDQVGNTAVGIVIMNFDNFTRVDYITLSQTTEGWKISKVVTTYP